MIQFHYSYYLVWVTGKRLKDGVEPLEIDMTEFLPPNESEKASVYENGIDDLGFYTTAGLQRYSQFTFVDIYPFLCRASKSDLLHDWINCIQNFSVISFLYSQVCAT